MLGRKLILKKTHDFCGVEKPKLAVVLIHGIASDSSTYSKALKYLEGTTSLKSVRFITFDLLGSGKSISDDKLDYGYEGQITALYNSIKKLKLKVPLILVGHSMGTLIAIKYASVYRKSLAHLILLCPPVYTPDDLNTPKFQAEMEAFKKVVAAKDKKYINNKAFEDEVEKIVLNKTNWDCLINLKTPAALIYSNADQIIMPSNVKKAVKKNNKYLSEIITIGTHKIAHDKYNKIREVLEEVLNA
ncbi:alpha/beta hydrolase [Candidatus Saccharibacteria bacterium]|nr:alpha/beta hydrolase [Candidatus Saccharibacteria bacterium]